MMSSEVISDFIGRLPAMKITEPYSPRPRARARTKPVTAAGATAIAVVLLLASFVALFLINVLQLWTVRRRSAEAR